MIHNAVLIVLEAVENLSSPGAIRALECSIELLNAVQIATETGEALGRLVQLKKIEATPGLEQLLTALLDAEPDCRAATVIAAAALKIKRRQSEPPRASMQ